MNRKPVIAVSGMAVAGVVISGLALTAINDSWHQVGIAVLWGILITCCLAGVAIAIHVLVEKTV